MYTYENITDEKFLEYLKYLKKAHEVITFRLDNNALITRINVNELTREDSIIMSLLKKWPERKFSIDIISIESVYFDLNDEFAKEYMLELGYVKKNVL